MQNIDPKYESLFTPWKIGNVEIKKPHCAVPDGQMPVVDSLGEEFLAYVQDSMTITIKDDGVVVVE